MLKRIGELLVERGLLTPLELERALKAQLIFGGHLGTCLIELGFVDERTFGQALADLHSLRYADPDLLNGIAPEVIERFPHEMAEKYRAVPIGGVEKTLELAVVDPRSLDGLSKRMGCKILPSVAPEFRIAEALETYYGIPRSARCVRLCDRLLRDAKFPRPTRSESELTAASMTPLAEIGGKTATPEELGAEFGYGKSWRDLADDLFRFEERDDHDAEVEEEEQTEDAAPTAQPPPSPGTVYERMSRAEDRDDLARIVLGFAAANMERAMLFSVKADTAAPWDWIGVDLPRVQARSLRFPVTGASVFSLMLGDGVYRGPVPGEPHHRFVYEALSIDVPREILLLPVYLNDRLVAIFHGDGGFTGRIRGETESYVVLLRRLGLALSMLVLKQKIRAEV